MRVVVVGAGPTGLFTGMALARRGHRVTVVDRDTGPRADGSWPRRGVMQFHHPHAFRAQVVEARQAELPEVWDDLLAAGAEPVAGPPGSDGPEELMAVRCRRSTFERVLRAAVERQPGVDLHIGHVVEVCIGRDRATGVRADGVTLDADLVMLRPAGPAGPTRPPSTRPRPGSRLRHRLRLPPVPPQPGGTARADELPQGQTDVYPCYQSIVFLHDNGIFSTLIVRPCHDRTLAALRLPEVWTERVGNPGQGRFEQRRVVLVRPARRPDAADTAAVAGHRPLHPLFAAVDRAAPGDLTGRDHRGIFPQVHSLW